MVRWVSKLQEETKWHDGEKTFTNARMAGGKAATSKRVHRRGKIQWGYVYGTVYAEVKRVLIQKKAEAGFYNLKRTDLTFDALAEVWLHSQRNAVKRIHLCALLVHAAQISSSGFE